MCVCVDVLFLGKILNSVLCIFGCGFYGFGFMFCLCLG